MRKIYYGKTLLLIMTLSIFTCLLYAQDAPISDKHIIFVGGVTSEVDIATNEPGDRNLLDSISQWVYVDYMPSDTFNMLEAAELYDGVDGVIISETIGSDAVPNFGPDRDDFPVPSIVMEMSCFNNEANKWNMYSATGGQEAHAPATAGDLQWKIVDITHYITEIFNFNEIVDYATGSPDRGIGYIYGLNDPVVKLAEPNAPLTNADAFAIGIINHPTNGILFMAVAKNYPAVDIATQGLFTVLRRSIEYMFDAYEPTLDEVTKNRNNLSFYPNPAGDYLNVMFPSNAGKLAEVSLINLAGQKVAINSFNTITGVNKIILNLDGVAQGIYFIRLKLDNEVTVEKVMIN